MIQVKPSMNGFAVYKYATGQIIPEGAVYLNTIKNGKMDSDDREFVWHYFLVAVKE